MSKKEFDDLDDFVLVRHLRYCFKQKGFRVRYVLFATTLLDASEHSVEDLAVLYAQRWQVEWDIQSLKAHMQMEHLRCKSPSMVRKEIYAHLISFSLIRYLSVRTALRHSTAPKYLSHTAAVQSLNAFSGNCKPEVAELINSKGSGWSQSVSIRSATENPEFTLEKSNAAPVHTSQ
ncbi:transposase [Rubripirellula reticaptiva]|uniref:Transposase DDE domain protein n=1 Tax=Rubripirellula reticaptiva TaxID=2528013 RepID=A0A5C6ESI3_9BACT|nr:transposase [Rubripirellula reticaptiva]TWU51595.1 Transposase DDE domain protein [Rubripirellula reticaptiva]